MWPPRRATRHRTCLQYINLRTNTTTACPKAGVLLLTVGSALLDESHEKLATHNATTIARRCYWLLMLMMMMVVVVVTMMIVMAMRRNDVRDVADSDIVAAVSLVLVTGSVVLHGNATGLRRTMDDRSSNTVECSSVCGHEQQNRIAREVGFRTGSGALGEAETH